MSSKEPPAETGRNDFIRAMVVRDLESGKYGGRVATRFPPEPNGYLHIGHAKSICLNFGIAEEFGGTCNLRYDDTNPETEDELFADAMAEDIRWLGYEWTQKLHASDCFEQMYEWAEQLIREGKAYVDSQTLDEMRASRGTVTEPGRDSPYRDRGVEENLDLFRRMRAGEFPDGAHVLRGRADMAHPNMLMRDPLLYRIRHAHHYRTGDDWCIYPMYDYAHCLEDAIEDITHSLCTLEFRNNREVYDWVLDAVGIEHPRPEQTEFARLNLDYTVVSKRKLIQLVDGEFVDGWDDPRMPTIAGLRRRGVPPEAIRTFCDMIGVADVDGRVDYGKLEFAIRDTLNWTAPRRLCVLDPLRVVITSYPDDAVEWIDAPEFPHDVGKPGSRRMPFTRELWIERADFMEEPVRKFRRLSPGVEVRLRNAYVVRCDEVVKDPATGEVVELRCTHDPDTLGANPTDGRKIKGTIHWVSAEHGLPCEVRLYDRLFSVPNPDDVEEGASFTDHLNPESRIVVTGARVEPAVADDPAGTRYQFERTGYFASDPVTSEPGGLVFNRIVPLRDSWTKRAGRN
jgi:glutaminyl-tRNA synthetase